MQKNYVAICSRLKLLNTSFGFIAEKQAILKDFLVSCEPSISNMAYDAQFLVLKAWKLYHEYN